MRRLFVFATVALFTLVCTSMAVDDPAATSGNTTYSQTDAFGDIISTIPSTNPGPSNAWVGNTYMNGELIQAKNVYPSTVPSQMVRINPSTGAIIATVNLPFNGYVIGFTNDGANLWVVQWSPLNMVYKVSIAGAQLASWPPNVSPFSARSAAYEGGNLWIGCDQSSAVTQLVKFSTAGVNLQTWSTGTAVGWYMDAEFSSNAPAGANLYIVDNVGNTLKRLAVGVSVTVAAQVASPAGSPDVAEGLGFDGEYLWHNGAYASQSLVWKLDDGFPGILNLNVVMTPINPPISIPSTGGQFNFNAAVTNNGAQTPFWAWARNRYPDGTYTGVLLGPVNINPPTGVTVQRIRTQVVPAGWPAGIHYMIGYAGSSVGYPAADRDSFMWTKTVVPGAGPIVWEAYNYGELFPGEVAVSAPAVFNLAGAYPNPFNPTTTISYSLPMTSRVTLNVYDMSGRLVSTLVNGLRDAGTHQETFDGSNLASGMYLYSLQAGQNVATGKMALVK
jgi:hypothetical protein